MTNGLAIGSMIAGTIGVVLFWTLVPPFILGPVAVVLGAIAKGRANRGAPNGGMAVVGIVLGVVAIVGALAMILLWTNVVTTTEVKIDEDGVVIGSLILAR